MACRQLSGALQIAIAAALLAGCDSGSGARRAQDAAAPDSAGWRLASAADGHLQVRYPDSLMRGVVDRWTRTCKRTVPVNVEDTLLLDRLVIAGVNAGTFDSIAPVLGFQWYADAWWLEPTDAGGWTGGLQADTIAVGEWRALSGEASLKVITGDEPPAAEGQRVTYTDFVQNRLVAVGPAIDGCHVVLFWWGAEREDAGARDDTIGTSVVRRLLANARVIER